MGPIPCTCSLSDLLCLSWNPNWQKQRSWAGFQKWIRSGLLSPSWPSRVSGCPSSMRWVCLAEKFIYGPLFSYFNWGILNGSKQKTSKPKGLPLKWCVIPSRLALSQLTKQKQILMLHLTNMQWVCLAVNIFYKFLYGPVVSYFNWSISNCSKLKTRKPKAFLLSDVWLFQDLLFPSWPSILGNSCYYTSPKCDQFIMLRIFLVLPCGHLLQQYNQRPCS